MLGNKPDHRDLPLAPAVLERFAHEPEMHRRYATCYAYEFFVARRVSSCNTGDVP
ncbi:MAG: hypothetical protein ACM3ZE_05845 [Myxococcales bacterium]